MSQEKPFDRAIKDNDFDMLVSFQGRDDFVQMRNCIRAKDIERRMIDRRAPVGGGSSRQNNLFDRGRVTHRLLFPRLSLGLQQRFGTANGDTWDAFILIRLLSAFQHGRKGIYRQSELRLCWIASSA